MGKKKTAQKSPTPKQTPPPLKEELSKPQPPPVEREETIIPASKLEELFKVANSNIDCAATIAAIGLTKKMTATMSVPPVETVLAPKTISHTTAEPTVEKPMPTTKGKKAKLSPPKEHKTAKEPLDVCLVSMYEPPKTREEREDVEEEMRGREEEVVAREKKAEEKGEDRSGEAEMSGEGGKAGEVEGGEDEEVERDEGEETNEVEEIE